ncbi:MAG: ferritin-like protein [Dehalococcoidia bacterium]|nr:ferritin-like protein [Dehalococcoidia bacterium]
MTDVVASHRDELVFMLNQATELEHSLSCSYLFTAFSLKKSVEEGLPADAVESVLGWKRSIIQVAVEEMFHLAVVNNLLTALGAAPNFDRPNFPHDCAWYLPDYQIELRPFSEEVLRHFIAVEQPDGSNLPAYTSPERLQRIEGDMDNKIGADPRQFDSQGDVYSVAENSLRALVERLGEENVFVGPPPRPAFRRFFESSGWEPIVDIGTTARNLAHVVEQGEGDSSGNPDSHYARFNRILEEYLAFRETHPGFEPAYPMLENPFTRTPPEANGPVNLIDHEPAIRLSDLFNEAYVSMLHLLARFFVMTDESDEEADALCNTAIETMAGTLVPLGELLARMPAGVRHPGRTAGPSFVVRTLHPLPYKDAAWRLLRERFGELADHADELSRAGLPELEQVAKTFRGVVRQLS